MHHPLLSVITVCYNSANLILDTLASIRSQRDPRFEYIVIDGGSTDGTLKILNDHSDIINTIISERDAGIYDAMNKGVRLARGRYILNLNSDDYLEAGSILIILNHLQKVGAPHNYIYTGATRLVDKNRNEVTRLMLSEMTYAGRYKNNPFPHPSTVISKDLIDKCNGYNCDYKIAADYDFFLKALLFNPKIHITSAIISNMRPGGASDEFRGLSAVISHQLELYKIQSKYISNYKAINFLIDRTIRLVIKKIIKWVN